MNSVTSASKSQPTAKPSDVAGKDVHVVKRGDTLSGIAKDHGVSLQKLVAANPQIKDPNLIFPGQHVNVPAKAAKPAEKAPAAAAREPASASTQNAARRQAANNQTAQRVAADVGRAAAALTAPNKPARVTVPHQAAPEKATTPSAARPATAPHGAAPTASPAAAPHGAAPTASPAAAPHGAASTTNPAASAAPPKPTAAKPTAAKPAVSAADTPKPKGTAQKAAWYQNLVKESGAKWRTGVNQVNIIGLRGQDVNGKRNHNTFNQWNDSMAYVWKGQDGKMHVKEFQATTDPGVKSGDGQDVDPAKHNGPDIAHLRPGSYPYHVGTHHGTYGAGNPGYNLPVDRDTNHDGSISAKERRDSIRRDDRGQSINIHWGDSSTVGGWSLGCQVIKGSEDHFMKNVRPLMEMNRGQMMYTLIDQSK